MAQVDSPLGGDRDRAEEGNDGLGDIARNIRGSLPDMTPAFLRRGRPQPPAPRRAPTMQTLGAWGGGGQERLFRSISGVQVDADPSLAPIPEIQVAMYNGEKAGTWGDMVHEFDLLNKEWDNHLFYDIDHEAESNGHGVSVQIPDDYLFVSAHWSTEGCRSKTEPPVLQANTGVGVFDSFVGKEIHRIHLDEEDTWIEITTAHEFRQLCRQKRNRKCQNAFVYVKGVHHKLRDEVDEITTATREYAEVGWKRDWALDKMRELRWKKIVMPRDEFLRVFFDYNVFHDEEGQTALPELPRSWDTEERFRERGGFTSILRTPYAKVKCARGTHAQARQDKYYELYQYDYRVNLPKEGPYQSPYTSPSDPEVGNRNSNLVFQ